MCYVGFAVLVGSCHGVEHDARYWSGGAGGAEHPISLEIRCSGVDASLAVFTVPIADETSLRLILKTNRRRWCGAFS